MKYTLIVLLAAAIQNSERYMEQVGAITFLLLFFLCFFFIYLPKKQNDGKEKQP